MSEYFGGEYVYSVLSSDSELFAYISDSLYNGLVIPADDKSLETVNFYRIGDLSGGAEVFQQQWSIDCRSETESGSKAIAHIVFSALNRKNGEAGSLEYYGVASIGQTLPPADSNDVFNTSVTLTLRRR